MKLLLSRWLRSVPPQILLVPVLRVYDVDSFLAFRCREAGLFSVYCLLGVLISDQHTVLYQYSHHRQILRGTVV